MYALPFFNHEHAVLVILKKKFSSVILSRDGQRCWNRLIRTPLVPDSQCTDVEVRCATKVLVIYFIGSIT